LEQNTPSQRQGVSAALAAAQAQAAATTPFRFPAEDGGRSLAEMAQRDLDAALQLLADRAQYITGASGAAIALRRNGRDDMLCRASVGSNAPELGALLSTEFGLSGESVRTRQLLRCDDAERDVRVNREVCRQMGIASVLVMPVVNDDQVLGVFELFSGKANAFGERDLSAVQRLSEMVETAVRLAHATETLPEQLSERESSVAEAIHPEVFEGQFLGDLVVEGVRASRQAPSVDQSVEVIAAAALESPVVSETPSSREVTAAANPPESRAEAAHQKIQSSYRESVPPSPAKKVLFWSAAAAGEAGRVPDGDQSRIPPVMRGLRKCEACGFPISAGRILCVECEEKKWRGQLQPQSSRRNSSDGVSTTPSSRPGGGFAAAVTMAKTKTESTAQASLEAGLDLPHMAAPLATATEKPEQQASRATTGDDSQQPAQTQDLVLSGGLETSRSWFSTNKPILLVLLVIGITVAGLLLFR